MKRMHWLLPGLILVLVLLGWWEGTPTAQAGVITVCPTGCDYDTIQGAVNAAAPSTTIQIFSATYTETVIITKTLTLEGVGQPQPVVSGNDVGRPFTILGSVAVTMTNMTVTRGRAPLGSDGNAYGGGIFNQGRLTLDHITLSHNQAIGANGQAIGDYGHFAYGGGLYSQCIGLVWPCPDIYLTSVTVISNTARGGDGNIGGFGGVAYGGGIFNDCFLSHPGCTSVHITDSRIAFNEARGGKGGDEQYPSYFGAKGGESRGGGFADSCIYACAAIELTRSEVYWNVTRGGDSGNAAFLPPPAPANAYGGGIHTFQLPLIQASHIHYNQAITGYHEPIPHGPYDESRGGGIHIVTITSYHVLEGGIHKSTIDHNQADVGGGLFISYSGLPITQSTISHNVARTCGAGILYIASSSALFDFVTIAANEVLDPPYSTGNSSPICPVGGGSGIYVSAMSGYSPSLKSSLLINNLNYDNEGEDCFGTVLSRGFNFTTECTLVGNLNGTILNQPIEIGALQDNGGRTPTHALLAGSVAIDAAAPADCPATDQRNFARWVDGNGDGIARCDMGAYEYGGAPTDVGLVGTIRGRNTSIPPLPLSLFALTLLFYRLRGRTTKHASRHDPIP